MDKKGVIVSAIECLLFIIYFVLYVFWNPSTNIGKAVMIIVGVLLIIWSVLTKRYWKKN